MESANLSVLRYLILPFFLLSFFLFASMVNAQGVPASPDSLTLTASPTNPSPGQQVIITAESYLIDINSATVVWSVNGKQLQSGVGQTSLTIQAPALGKISNVSVVALSTGGQQVTGTITVGSGSVDMIVEPDGYVPPLFAGKLPVAYQNGVKIIAIPHIANSSGTEYDLASLVYTWKQNDGTVLQDQSGYGKQSVTIPGSPVPRPYVITVDVSSRDGSVSTEGNVLITPQVPTLTFYINDPLYGPLFNSAVGNSVYIGSEKEVDVLAVPYGFDGAQSGSGALSYDWLVNGNSDSALDSSDSIVLRAPANSSGSSNIQLNATSLGDVLQQASGAFSAVFNSNQQSSSATTAF